MSTIQIQCINKTLTIIDSPSIEIGGVNSLQFSFCPLWDGYSKTVHFYKNETDCNPVEIINDVAVIPSGLISEGASFFFFVDGVSGELKRRSQIFKCKIESSLLVVENPDSDIQLRLIDIVQNLDLEFGYDDLTEEQKADLRKGLSSINAQYTSTFNVAELTQRIPINIPEYSHGIDILQVYINGMRLIEGTDYTNDGTHISLIKPLNVIGQVHIAVTKAISLSDKEWESLQPEEIEAITSLEIDKLMEM